MSNCCLAHASRPSCEGRMAAAALLLSHPNIFFSLSLLSRTGLHRGERQLNVVDVVSDSRRAALLQQARSSSRPSFTLHTVPQTTPAAGTPPPPAAAAFCGSWNPFFTSQSHVWHGEGYLTSRSSALVFVPPHPDLARRSRRATPLPAVERKKGGCWERQRRLDDRVDGPLAARYLTVSSQPLCREPTARITLREAACQS